MAPPATSSASNRLGLYGTAPAQPLFNGYARHATAWDELFAGPGEPHGHCAALIDRLGQLLLSDFQQRRTD